MNHLVAKTKGRNKAFFKIISNEKIFDLPGDLDNQKEYNAAYKLEDDEWFVIEDFSGKTYCEEFVQKKFVSTDYNQLPVGDYDKIDYLCAVQAGVYYFQKMSPSQMIRKKYFCLSDAPTLVENNPIIVINPFPDAIYIKKEDKLCFKRLSSITAIFKGIDTLYKEATQEETEQFLQNNFIRLGNDFSAHAVKTANRKRIAMAMDTLQRFSSLEKGLIFGYIREYCGGLNFDEQAANFTISCEEELKQLLYGIEQRYYTTMIGNEKRLANSVMSLS